MNTEILQFLIHDCTAEELLEALAAKTQEYTKPEQVEAAALAYIANRERYKPGLPPRGEGYRYFGEVFRVDFRRIARKVEQIEHG